MVVGQAGVERESLGLARFTSSQIRRWRMCEVRGKTKSWRDRRQNKSLQVAACSLGSPVSQPVSRFLFLSLSLFLARELAPIEHLLVGAQPLAPARRSPPWPQTPVFAG